MEAVNILKWVLLKQSPSPPHPSDTLKAQVNGHQCRVPACRACGSVKTERPRKKKKKRESERRFYRKSLWTCADMLWRISTLRLRRPTQLEGKTENRTRCEKNNNKKKHSFAFFTRRGNSWNTPGVSYDMFHNDICLWIYQRCSFTEASGCHY